MLENGEYVYSASEAWTPTVSFIGSNLIDNTGIGSNTDYSDTDILFVTGNVIFFKTTSIAGSELHAIHIEHSINYS